MWQVFPEVLWPVGIETMLSNREVGWGDWFSSGTVLALRHVAHLLSMVFGENRLFPGLQNMETMLRTLEALGVLRPAPRRTRPATRSAAPPRCFMSWRCGRINVE